MQISSKRVSDSTWGKTELVPPAPHLRQVLLLGFQSPEFRSSFSLLEDNETSVFPPAQWGKVYLTEGKGCPPSNWRLLCPLAPALRSITQRGGPDCFASLHCSRPRLRRMLLGPRSLLRLGWISLHTLPAYCQEVGWFGVWIGLLGRESRSPAEKGS